MLVNEFLMINFLLGFGINKSLAKFDKFKQANNRGYTCYDRHRIYLFIWHESLFGRIVILRWTPTGQYPEETLKTVKKSSRRTRVIFTNKRKGAMITAGSPQAIHAEGAHYTRRRHERGARPECSVKYNTGILLEIGRIH